MTKWGGVLTVLNGIRVLFILILLFIIIYFNLDWIGGGVVWGFCYIFCYIDVRRTFSCSVYAQPVYAVLNQCCCTGNTEICAVV